MTLPEFEAALIMLEFRLVSATDDTTTYKLNNLRVGIFQTNKQNDSYYIHVGTSPRVDTYFEDTTKALQFIAHKLGTKPTNS